MAVMRVRLDQLHQFVFVRKAYVAFLPKRPGGESFGGCSYEFDVASQRDKGWVGSDGVIRHQVPRTARTATLRIWPSPLPDEGPLEWRLDIGKRLTIKTFAGVRWRLENLGFDCGGETKLGPATRKAARAFMEYMGLMSAADQLERTGTIQMETDLTDELRKALDQEYRRPAGLHHGAELRQDPDQIDWQGP
ncbi:hypothetical protein [Duganella violaceipulchra]|uniref:Uncharacterized protein n=1 Tax=Duganella violaceipulchra TaxID=2849652 RepID=A0AA41L1C8_9BURK|nr:hypothetical protein [Duganella violaceicalia]MBV6324581.1 hypothetical protein [Duganella violaceicalia]MCP2009288.1 hypothetical protein [Duganella violaceicalia]